MKGTLLNTSAVAGGALLGLAIGKTIPTGYQDVALHGIGLVNLGFGISLFTKSKNLIAMAGAITLGGILGAALGIQAGLDAFAEWTRSVLGSQRNTFNEGLITTSVLFCMGPMTLMGCLQDGLEGKIELLGLKSLLDGVSSIFFAAALGAGVLVTAVVVLVVQGTLTLAARPLKRFAQDTELVDESGAAGGMLLMGIGLGLLDIKKLGMATYLPALILMPLFVSLARRWSKDATQSAKVG